MHYFLNASADSCLRLKLRKKSIAGKLMTIGKCPTLLCWNDFCVGHFGPFTQYYYSQAVLQFSLDTSYFDTIVQLGRGWRFWNLSQATCIRDLLERFLETSKRGDQQLEVHLVVVARADVCTLARNDSCSKEFSEDVLQYRIYQRTLLNLVQRSVMSH